MKPLVQHHVLRNVQLEGWHERIAGQWHYNDLANDPQWRHGWISFDAVTFNPEDQKIYCGLNSIDGDLLYRFDPVSSKFEGLDTKRWSDEFDSKIHRTMLRNPVDDCFYFATSLLHDADRQRDAGGGKLVRYDWRKNEYKILAIPQPHLYIQSIAADWKRGILYGFTYPMETVFRFDIQTGESRQIAYIGNSLMMAQPHNAVVDDEGWLWGTYAETRAWDEVLSEHPVRLFKYHPDEDRMIWLKHGLSRRNSSKQLISDLIVPWQEMDRTETRHKEDYGFCDSMIYDGKRFIYVGTVAGVLCRIDTQTSAVEKITTAVATGRLPALGWDKEGRLYGAGGLKGKTVLFRYNPQNHAMEYWDSLKDEPTGETPARIHELTVSDDGTVYMAENDHHRRSSYLWSVKV